MVSNAALQGQRHATEPPSAASGPPTSATKGVLDLALALAVFGLTLGVATGLLDTGSYAGTVDPRNVGLAALASLPLLGARRAPLAAFALTAAGVAALTWIGAPLNHGPGPTIALYFLAVNPPTGRAGRWLAAPTVVGFFVLIAYLDRLDNNHALEPVPALFWLGAWVLGDGVRQHRERRVRLAEAARLAERGREREQRLLVAEERTRIARDLHDSAGHALNVILVQAGATRLLAERDPVRARQAVQTIEEVARETVGEIDQLVGALRENNITGRSTNEPLPGLAALDRLVERAAGLAITVERTGEHRALHPRVDQGAYRILQEALTNAARHGSGTAAVDVCFEAETLVLSVRSPTKPGSTHTDTGHGIVGMRERAALLGGRLSTEADDGVFRVEAELPYTPKQP